MIDYIIIELTKKLIELDFDEKQNGSNIYVKKTECYRSLIQFLKENKEIIKEII